jgi:hypothetical protein
VVDREALAINLAAARAVVERVDLVVEPVTLRVVGVDLAPESVRIFRRRVFASAAAV